MQLIARFEGTRKLRISKLGTRIVMYYSTNIYYRRIVVAECLRRYSQLERPVNKARVHNPE